MGLKISHTSHCYSDERRHIYTSVSEAGSEGVKKSHTSTNSQNETPTHSLTKSYNKLNGNIRPELGNKYFMASSSIISLEKTLVSL